MKKGFVYLLIFGLSSCLIYSQMINEIRIDQIGTDNDEYFELVGTPGTSLNGLSYLVIGDGATGSGVVKKSR